MFSPNGGSVKKNVVPLMTAIPGLREKLPEPRLIIAPTASVLIVAKCLH
jgi:hypothetical protein